MSVALLSGNKDVQVCDELESFFYVLLYFATRYLHSPLPDITTANYLDEFFDHYGVGEGRYVCGDKKKNTIANGCLEVADTVMLRFDSNMDDVLADILSWFKAHHEVTRHEAEKAKAEAKAAASRSAAVTPQTSSGDLKSVAPARRAAVVSRAPPRVSLPGRGLKRLRDGPSEEVREQAKQASSHAAFVTLLEEAESALGWSGDDKAGDRIPATWRPDKKFDDDSTCLSGAGTSNKKQKTNPGGSLPLTLDQQRPAKTPPPPTPPTGPHVSLAPV